MLSVIISSCPPDQAQRIADALLEQRVAACVSALSGVTSTYRWQGQLQRDPETLLIIKTPTDQVSACMAALQAVHPYSVPEMVVLAADRVSEAYLQWAIAETRDQQPQLLDCPSAPTAPVAPANRESGARHAGRS